MKIVVGLGNPGSKYSLTRHNLGFLALETLARRHNTDHLWQNKKNSRLTEYRLNEKIILAQPQTYMNLSGEAVSELVNWYKITADDIIIVCDDVALPAGKLRLRQKGSCGGHNGLESIIDHLGTNDFPRLRIGIGKPPDGWDLADYVLGQLSQEELKLFTEVLTLAADAIECILERGLTEAMNRYN